MHKGFRLLKEFPAPRPALRVEYYYAGPIQKGGSYALAWSDLGITPELDQPLSEHLDVILRGRCGEDWQDAVVTDLVTYTHTLTNLRFVLHDVFGWPAWWPPEGTVYIVKKEDK